MGEEEKKLEKAKKPEEEAKKEEAPKADEKTSEQTKEKKSEESKEAAPPPPPPQEIILKVYMHCEGCARKVRRCLKDFQGVEDVITDCKTSKVIVKGEKADPIKVLERVQRKSHRQVELLSPIPKPVAEEPKKPEEKEMAKAEEKKPEPPVITVILHVYMHCEACAQAIRKRIQRMKGAESAEPDLKSSQVTVKGMFEPEDLVDYVYKRTGKHAVIVKVEPDKKEDEKEKEKDCKDEKKTGGEKKEAKKGGEEAKENKEGGGGEEPPAKPEDDTKLDLKKNEFYHYYPQNYQIQPQRFVQEHIDIGYAPQIFIDENQRFVQEHIDIGYAPQIFSDENPNACSVM
ncbi:heavy metal-associated isoprenylated plant protein 7-like [Olea europaea var. sylvestris]|uniref:Heavy metal-associated isoprenylated plant 7-like n=1 Tax=Olea europaea subsp. europaea TaxID=158383 RepID=A0A8S0TYX5_OLEEU|nr:heavy metal-associated isoprenylated plant protein 7-like [Olea europaea var. sylvestris]CAA3011272.1 heavy metal-associated isoprenylated plant 7-like [Olea europaea subsp. europaea]